MKCREFAICSYKPFGRSAVIRFYSGKLGNSFTDVTGHNVAEKNWILVGRSCRDLNPKMRWNRYQNFFFSFFKRSSGMTNIAVVMFLWLSFMNNHYREKSYLAADFFIKIYINMGGMASTTLTQPKTPICSTSSEIDKCLQLLSPRNHCPLVTQCQFDCYVFVHTKFISKKMP